MKKHKLQILIENAGLEPRSYSGRGMFGDKCLGVNCDNPLEMFAEILESDDLDPLSDALDTVTHAMRKATTDSMGRGQIIYWPTIPYVSDNDA